MTTPPVQTHYISRWRIDEQSVPFVLLFIVLAALACTTPPQNDTWWHLRSGQEMWRTGAFLTRETFSYPSAGAELHNHWWLSQLIFYAMHSLGGPPLLSIFAGTCAAIAVFLSWKLTKESSIDVRLFLLLFLIIATARGWAVRPQVISLVFMVTSAHLITSGRSRWLPILCVVWANAHALVIFGVMMAGCLVLEAAVWSRGSLRRDVLTFALCAISPMCSPVGWNYWPQVLTTVTTSKALELEEYRLPVEFVDAPFWMMVGTLALLTVRRRGHLAKLGRANRLNLIASGALAVAGFTAARNIAFFAVIAAPAAAALLTARAAARRRLAPWPAVALIAIASAAATLYVSGRWQGDGTKLGWKPISPEAMTAVDGCRGPLFNHMEDGGFIMWALPDRKVFVDSRMEAYPLAFLEQVRRAELEGDYRELFERYRIACALIKTGSRLHAAVRSDPAMMPTYGDTQRVVFTRQTVGTQSDGDSAAPLSH